MRFSVPGLALFLPVLIAATPAHAASVVDPTGDFLASFAGPNRPDLDVTSFSVAFNPTTNIFTLGATLAGDIDQTDGSLYVIGVNTGTGTARPFATIGEPNVIFNQAIAINANGTGAIGSTVLDPANISITGNIFTARIALSLLPSTGFSPEQYGFNLWPRTGLGNNNQISDFAPENRTLSVAPAVPEPKTWALMLLGFGVVGSAARRTRRKSGAALA